MTTRKKLLNDFFPSDKVVSQDSYVCCCTTTYLQKWTYSCEENLFIFVEGSGWFVIFNNDKELYKLRELPATRFKIAISKHYLFIWYADTHDFYIVEGTSGMVVFKYENVHPQYDFSFDDMLPYDSQLILTESGEFCFVSFHLPINTNWQYVFAFCGKNRLFEFEQRVLSLNFNLQTVGGVSQIVDNSVDANDSFVILRIGGVLFMLHNGGVIYEKVDYDSVSSGGYQSYLGYFRSIVIDGGFRLVHLLTTNRLYEYYIFYNDILVDDNWSRGTLMHHAIYRPLTDYIAICFSDFTAICYYKDEQEIHDVFLWNSSNSMVNFSMRFEYLSVWENNVVDTNARIIKIRQYKDGQLILDLSISKQDVVLKCWHGGDQLAFIDMSLGEYNVYFQGSLTETGIVTPMEESTISYYSQECQIGGYNRGSDSVLWQSGNNAPLVAFANGHKTSINSTLCSVKSGTVMQTIYVPEATNEGTTGVLIDRIAYINNTAIYDKKLYIEGCTINVVKDDKNYNTISITISRGDINFNPNLSSIQFQQFDDYVCYDGKIYYNFTYIYTAPITSVWLKKCGNYVCAYLMSAHAPVGTILYYKIAGAIVFSASEVLAEVQPYVTGYSAQTATVWYFESLDILFIGRYGAKVFIRGGIVVDQADYPDIDLFKSNTRITFLYDAMDGNIFYCVSSPSDDKKYVMLLISNTEGSLTEIPFAWNTFEALGKYGQNWNKKTTDWWADWQNDGVNYSNSLTLLNNFYNRFGGSGDKIFSTFGYGYSLFLKSDITGLSSALYNTILLVFSKKYGLYAYNLNSKTEKFLPLDAF